MALFNFVFVVRFALLNADNGVAPSFSKELTLVCFIPIERANSV